MTESLGDSGEFWDFSENNDYTTLKANDGLYYKVWNEGPESVKQEIANTLAKVRKDLNKLLICIMKNPECWNSKPSR